MQHFDLIVILLHDITFFEIELQKRYFFGLKQETSFYGEGANVTKQKFVLLQNYSLELIFKMF